jgi:hypothetical protein
MVRDRYGVWSAVTEDLSTRGCGIVTSRLLRPGTFLRMTFSSDLFHEDHEACGVAAWSSGERLGVVFSEAPIAAGAGSLSAWLKKVVEHGAMPDSSTTFRVAPSVQRVAAVPVRLARVEPPVAQPELRYITPDDVRPAASGHVVSAPQSAIRLTARSRT